MIYTPLMILDAVNNNALYQKSSKVWGQWDIFIERNYIKVPV